MKAEPERCTRYGFETLACARKEVKLTVLRRMSRRQGGQGMVEYALILVLVSIVVIVILLTMGNQIQNVFSNVVAALG
jgi:pilus assembly protein Flp/PilA